MKSKGIWSIVLTILPFGLIVLAVFYFGGPIKQFLQGFLNGISDAGKKLTDMVGITDSKSQVYVNSNLASSDNCFDPKFYTKLSQKSLSNFADAKTLAIQIHDSIVGKIGFTFYVDGNAALGAIQRCKTQAQVSWVADVFNRTYKADMLSYMNSPGFFRSGLNSDALQKIIDYATKLPLQ